MDKDKKGLSAIPEDQFSAELMEEFAQEEFKQIQEEKAVIAKLKEQLKGLIDADALFAALSVGHSWAPEAIVDVVKTDEQLPGGYPPHKCVRIKDDPDKLLYMSTDFEEEFGEEPFELKNCFVWQTTGYICDDYSGFLLFPLSNGKYLKVSYSC